MHDLLPDEMARFRRIEQAFRLACQAWGFQEIRTPTLEHLYLFTSAGTLSPQLLGRVYSFLDWDGWTGERVVLRPDATIPVARLFREQMRSDLAKLAYVANIFRFSNDAAEPREVWQCGAELIGDSWPSGDIELIRMMLRIINDLQLSGATVRLSHTGIVRSIFERAGFVPHEQAELYDRLLDGDRQVLGDVEARLPELGAALRLLSSVGTAGPGFIANLRSAFLPVVPGMAGPLDELALVVGAAAASGAAVEVSVTDIHDFEYYTGPVFRVDVDGRTVAGGGRYDDLISGPGGRSLPACGFALHVDRILPLMRSSGLEDGTRVRVVPADTTAEALAAAADLCENLQAGGLVAGLVETDSEARTVTLEGAGERVRYRIRGASGQESYVPSVQQVLAALRGG
jgi:histidyl-tRNA synthetase